MSPDSTGSLPEADAALDDPRVFEAMQEYLAEVEAGRRPDRQAFLARHAAIAGPLAECLGGLDVVRSAAAQLQHLVPALLTSVPTDLPDPLGDFRLVREIGRGGMGVVYEAVQLSLGRRVALKVLPFAAALDARHLQRFKNEAQAAAQLHHTNIVPVYQVGCERGVHYYAMQLIEGQSLAALIDEAQAQLSSPGAAAGQAPTQPVAGLSTLQTTTGAARYRTAAGWALQAALGLEHAHQLGIVHRDIKPANLLLDVRGNLWITDFGLAQFNADAGLTRTGDLVGTLRYMSPEQALGHRVVLDHRTDIYSLGVTLYELLTLHPVFPGNDRQELLRHILYDEPRPPRALDPGIPVELETVVLKAMAKVPAERYATAQELADDLQRFLHDRPVRARRPSWSERVRRWMRRHPAVVRSGVVVLVLSLVGLGLSNWRIAREQEKTQAALERAEERFRQARRAVDFFIEVAEEELADKPFLSSLRQRLLEAALLHYQDFIEQRHDAPELRAELEAGRARVAELLGELALLRNHGQFLLLREPSVAADLGLSAEQRAELAALWPRVGGRQREHTRDFLSQDPEGRRQRFLQQAREHDQAVAAILTPAQTRRLRQIALQMQGPNALREPEVVEALQLTPEQRARLRAIEMETMILLPQPLPPPPEVRGTGKGPEGLRGPDRLWSQARDRLLATLTPAQQEQWRQLTGEPFRGELFRIGPGTRLPVHPDRLEKGERP